jgi:hypothetical protein
MLGKHHTEEHKEYMRKLYTGRPISEEQKIKLSAAKKGKTWEEIYGIAGAITRRKQQSITKRIKASEETKQKMSETHKKRWSTVTDGDKKTIYKKISERNKGKIRTEETKNNLSKWFMGSIYINNGIENRRIQKDVEMPDGWVKGRLSYKKCNKVQKSVVTELP